ncbi:hypothetical protein MSTE_02019 [Mycobacteroides stephanolepidis]|uniref:DUF3558 domain-containing protein n=1 Tax=[Mycobacterium] stephanolepidis TaxID=1520670 RepID=A0A1Z4EWJ5_9MYCO|nr:DUF3558 domain-containing protein [[Mycobacterium] stephanolepidis]BAX97335.1 hypothetical protein MSTE_02019 [[Mycobacterium] stephanolepidis]
MRAFLTVVVATGLCLAAAACSGGVTGTPVAGSSSGTSSSIGAPAPLPGVSPPTTAAPNPNVTGTTFDGCASVTDTEAQSWQLDPASKVDLAGKLFSENGRGCRWIGSQGDLKVYAIDGSLSQWDKPIARYDRQEKITIGSRTGWLLHNVNQAICSVALPSQNGIATVQVDLNSELTKARYDQCPLAVQIATTVEPRIP